MNRAFGIMLGWRNFLGSFRRGASRILLSSSLAMALGLVPLVVVMSIADGMISGISSRTIETSTYHFQLWPVLGQTDQTTEAARAQLQAQMSAIPGFKGLWAERDGFALVYSPAGRLGVNLRGVEPQWLNQDAALRSYLRIQEGRDVFPEEGSVWIGKEVAQKLSLKVGDDLKILTARPSMGRVLAPRITTLKVAAIFTIGYQELDKLWVFLPYKQAEKILYAQEFPTFWGIKVSDPYHQLENQQQALTQVTGGNWQVQTWQELARSQFLNYQATRTLLGLIMALILLVSVVNITTAMITMVLERQEEIAILKAVGFSPGAVGNQFLFLGLLTGTLGAAVGIGLGVVLSLGINHLISLADWTVNSLSGFLSWVSGGASSPFHLLNSDYYLEKIQVIIDPPFLLFAGGFSVVLAVLASTIPARRAARLRPLDVFRKI